MKKLCMTFCLSAALALPLCAVAAPQDRHDDHDDRGYYDRHHKDYHKWDDHEDRAYHAYWEQHHRSYVEWNAATPRQQQNYWDWRHRHSDSMLKIEVR